MEQVAMWLPSAIVIGGGFIMWFKFFGNLATKSDIQGLKQDFHDEMKEVKLAIEKLNDKKVDEKLFNETVKRLENQMKP